jgi:hypothetical protein
MGHSIEFEHDGECFRPNDGSFVLLSYVALLFVSSARYMVHARLVHYKVGVILLLRLTLPMNHLSILLCRRFLLASSRTQQVLENEMGSSAVRCLRAMVRTGREQGCLRNRLLSPFSRMLLPQIRIVK